MGSFSRYGLILVLAILFAAKGAFAEDTATSLTPRLIAIQEPPKVVQQLLARATHENTSLVISLGSQRAQLMVDGEVAIDMPISSGRRPHFTPTGNFKIAEKFPERRSNLYGDFVDREGRVVQAGVSSKIDSALSGTVFRIAPAQFVMRLEPEGVFIHAGRLPGYKTTDGTVRLPRDIASLVYQRVGEGTPVTITE